MELQLSMAFAGLPHVQSSLGPRFGGISVQSLGDGLVGGFKSIKSDKEWWFQIWGGSINGGTPKMERL